MSTKAPNSLSEDPCAQSPDAESRDAGVDLQQLQERLAWLESRNGQLVEALEGLERERSHYFKLFDQLPQGVCAVGSDGRIVDANRHLAFLCGLSREQVVGKALLMLVPEGEQDTLASLLREARDTRDSRCAQVHLQRRDLSLCSVQVCLQIQLDSGGEALVLATFSQGVESQTASDLVEESERFHLAMEAGGVGVFDWDLASGKLTWDSQMFRLYGVNPEHFSGAYEAWRAGLHPEDLSRAEAEVQQALRGERELDTEFRVLRPDGDIRSIRALGVVLRDAQGRPMRMLGTNWDITRRVELEERLGASEANFRSFFDSVSDLLVVADMQGHIFYSNRSLRSKLGYSQDELTSMHVLDLHPSDRRAEAEEIFAAMFRGTRDSCPLPLGRKDGSLLPVETRVWFGRWNNADCVFGVCKDLGEEEDAKQRFERLFRSNPSPMALSVMPQRWFVDVNEAFMKVLGYSWNEVVGKSSQEIDLFLEPEKQVLLGNLLAVGGRFADVEMKVRRRDGEIIDGLFSGEMVRSQGKTYLLTVMLDITSRKKAEAALAVERERLAAIIRGTDAGTWAWNIQSGETVFNERWAEMLGYSLDELAPVSIDTWMALAHPGDLLRSGDALAKHFNGELDYYECESRMRHKDGSWVWVLDRGRLDSRSQDGRPLMMFGTHQDITARKRAEAALQLRVELEELVVRLSARLMSAHEDNLDEVINAVLAALGQFAKVDRSYHFRVHPHGQSMSNTHEWCAPGIEAQMENLQDLPVDVAPAWMEEMRLNRIVHIPSVEDLPEDWSIEREILGSQGIQSLLALPIFAGEDFKGFIGFDAVRERRVWLEEDQLILRFLADNIGLTLQGVEQQRDLRLASEEALRLAAEADAANRAKSHFLANISHEFRTHMNSMLGFTQIIQQELGADSPQNRHLKTILSSGTHLLQLIDDILDMSRSESATEACRPEAFSLTALQRELEHAIAPRCAAKGLQFHVESQGHLPQIILSDPVLIRRIMLHLLGNAVKFTLQGGVTLGLSVVGQGSEGLVRLWVRDTGPGLTPHQGQQLLEIFQQSAPVKDQGHRGLAQSTRLANLLGGRLQADAPQGKGSLFTLEFPWVAVGGGSALQARQALAHWASSRPDQVVLVVDDQKDNRSVLCEMLRPLGLHVVEAENGAQAVECAAREKPWLVLMDMRMPVMGGAEAVEMLRALPDGPHMRIIAVTASTRMDEDLRSGPEGVDHYLRKPFDVSDLLSLLASFLPVVEEDRQTGCDNESVAPAQPGLPPVPEWLTSEQRAAMRLALEDGDTTSLAVHVQSIAQRDGRLAQHVGQLLDAYDYPTLIQWLDMGQ